MPSQRATAYKARIDDVVNAEYVSQEPPNPNYLSLYGERVQRLQLIAVLVQKSSHHFVLDDGTNRITAKRFNQGIDLSDVSTGDTLLVIARPREHDSTIFLGAETVRQVSDKAWIEVHHGCVDALYNTEAQTVEEQMEEDPVDDEETDVVNYSEVIIEAINEIDGGDGAPTNKVIDQTDLDDPEHYIDLLINEGEIFEIRPGRLKVL